LAAVDEPISAPSANRSGHVSPTSARHVLDEFAEVSEARDLLILDDGPCEVGIESTVLDVTALPHPRILRHGSVTLEQLREILGEDVESSALTMQTASPGTSESHYAPRTPTQVVSTRDLPATLKRMSDARLRVAALAFDAGAIAPPHVVVAMPRDAERYAHELYQRLREADASGCQRIIVEAPPHDSHVWRAVHDRLRRAAAGSP
jgi:L-threonylcarbamoyladenylate synthase